MDVPCGRDPDGIDALLQMFSPSAHRDAVASGEVSSSKMSAQ